MLQELVREIGLNPGWNQTLLPQVRVCSVREPYSRKECMLTPSLFFLVSGRRFVFFNGCDYEVNPSSYLISSANLPAAEELQHLNCDQPLWGVEVLLDPELIGSTLSLLEKERYIWLHDCEECELVRSQNLDSMIEGCLTRLLSASIDRTDVTVLGHHLLQELYYRVMQGPCGYILRNSILNHTRASSIAGAIQYINSQYHEELSVGLLAGLAGMSEAALNKAFKLETAYTPMQFVKRVRLHKARQLLLAGVSASSAAYQCGYHSPAQFSREFKRFFEKSPSSLRKKA